MAQYSVHTRPYLQSISFFLLCCKASFFFLTYEVLCSYLRFFLKLSIFFTDFNKCTILILDFKNNFRYRNALQLNLHRKNT